jgi:hypothetical protein
MPTTKKTPPTPPGMPPDAMPFDDLTAQVKLWAKFSPTAADLLCAAINRGRSQRHRLKRSTATD